MKTALYYKQDGKLIRFTAGSPARDIDIVSTRERAKYALYKSGINWPSGAVLCAITNDQTMER